MSEKKSTTENQKQTTSKRSVFQALGKTVERVYKPFLESFLPEPHYLEEETVDRVIRMATYRARVPQTMGVVGIALFIPALIAFLITLLVQSDTGLMISGGIAIAALFLLFESAEGWLTYNQW